MQSNQLDIENVHNVITKEHFTVTEIYDEINFNFIDLLSQPSLTTGKPL
jgi:hypothetical protein